MDNNEENLMEETFTKEGLYPDEDAVLKEAWPIPFQDMVREFEDYLEEIGVRI